MIQTVCPSLSALRWLVIGDCILFRLMCPDKHQLCVKIKQSKGQSARSDIETDQIKAEKWPQIDHTVYRKQNEKKVKERLEICHIYCGVLSQLMSFFVIKYFSVSLLAHYLSVYRIGGRHRLQHLMAFRSGDSVVFCVFFPYIFFSIRHLTIKNALPLIVLLNNAPQINSPFEIFHLDSVAHVNNFMETFWTLVRSITLLSDFRLSVTLAAISHVRLDAAPK